MGRHRYKPNWMTNLHSCFPVALLEGNIVCVNRDAELEKMLEQALAKAHEQHSQGRNIRSRQGPWLKVEKGEYWDGDARVD